MRHVIVAWANSDADSFEAHVPLEFTAKRYRARGYTAAFKVVMLRGYENIGTHYRGRLLDLGFEIVDASDSYREARSTFDCLSRFGEYELSCFLRWPVLRKLFGDEGVIHYDGDVVLNVPPEDVESILAGSTFVLQGCPAFTIISDPAWYEAYETELRHFAADIDGYSATAWSERAGWEKSAAHKWAGSRSRKTISSDQDFISHLIHTDRLPQTRKELLLERLGPWMAIENPLYPDAYYPSTPFSYRRLDGVDTFNGRPLLMWHMQTSFFLYLSRHLVQQRYASPLASRRLSRDLEGIEQLAYRAAAKLIANSPVTRRSVYEAFLDDDDFSEVFAEQ
ncbi:MAG TPA: hypothetical protein VM939_08860, partial [Gemmatimonadaceae bacterium]|nr:hypothetical protein [Gemmatimonadaceae bacterium]